MENKIKMLEAIGTMVLRTGRGILWGSIGFAIGHGVAKKIRTEIKENRKDKDGWREVLEE